MTTTSHYSAQLLPVPVCPHWSSCDSCDDRYVMRTGGCLWSQCALTDHLLITRDWAPVSSPGSRAELTGRAQAQLPRSDRACRFWSRAREAQCSQASEISSRHNKLDFSSFREKLRPGESSERYAHVTKTDRDSRPDIWRHLEPSVIVGLFRNDG